MGELPPLGELINIRPMGTIKNQYVDQKRWNLEHGKSLFNDLVENPGKWRNKEFPEKNILVGQKVMNPGGKRILELGAGRGETAIYLAAKGAQVTATDIGEDLVEFANQYAEIMGVKINASKMSCIEIDFENGSFDAVVGCAILHHLPKHGVAECLKESFRVLRPGGIAVFLEPVENNKLFDFLQNCVPRGRPGN